MGKDAIQAIEIPALAVLPARFSSNAQSKIKASLTLGTDPQQPTPLTIRGAMRVVEFDWKHPDTKTGGDPKFKVSEEPYPLNVLVLGFPEDPEPAGDAYSEETLRFMLHMLYAGFLQAREESKEVMAQPSSTPSKDPTCVVRTRNWVPRKNTKKYVAAALLQMVAAAAAGVELQMYAMSVAKNLERWLANRMKNGIWSGKYNPVTVSALIRQVMDDTSNWEGLVDKDAERWEDDAKDSHRKEMVV